MVIHNCFCFMFAIFMVYAEMDYQNTEEQVKKSFTKLLKNLISLNEERLNTIKKLNRLDDMYLTKNRFREFDNTNIYNDNESNENFMETPGYLASFDDYDDKDSSPRRNKRHFKIDSKIINLIIPKKYTSNGIRDQENEKDFRRSWHSSCDKKAARICKNACKQAYKNGCKIFKCTRRAKTTFKRECKKSCAAKFRSNEYSDSDYE